MTRLRPQTSQKVGLRRFLLASLATLAVSDSFIFAQTNHFSNYASFTNTQTVGTYGAQTPDQSPYLTFPGPPNTPSAQSQSHVNSGYGHSPMTAQPGQYIRVVRPVIHAGAPGAVGPMGYGGLPGSGHTMFGFQQWSEFEPEYLIHPGDQLDIVVSSAPELSRTLTVGPDGRIVMPMVDPIMVAGRGFRFARQAISNELSKQLRDPTVSITPRAYAPEQVFVGGEVTQPGTYTLPGRIGAIEAIFMAGGFQSSARSGQVAVLRRAPNGGMMMRVVNLRGGLKGRMPYNDTRQLRRGDIVFVPKTTLAEVGEFVQGIRAAIPVDLNIGYQLGLNNQNGFNVNPTTTTGPATTP